MKPIRDTVNSRFEKVCVHCSGQFHLPEVVNKLVPKTQDIYCPFCGKVHNSRIPPKVMDPRSAQTRLSLADKTLQGLSEKQLRKIKKLESQIKQLKDKLNNQRNEISKGRCICCTAVITELQDHFKQKHSLY